MREVTAYAPCPSACRANFVGGNEDFAAWEMCKSAIMIHMQVGENNPFHITRTDAQCTQLRTDLLFRIDSKNNLPSSKGMIRPPSFQQMRSLAGVDDNNTLTVSIAHAYVGNHSVQFRSA